ncbi:hypothetical protein PCCS19_38340 [Paenibacillus sp. CCS19]|uniref:hypothetical protein n=1 Tax=Paenibacillus sp. CCS19 TaxID=3158387 RepID=UPI0025699053|nr:hypothetical protein [Paenibacillus cellulosilyticus]GMK40778.1 hypothetical protein PCCS19_38340 [Paenibacillus cellulosilyticus]
MTSMKRMAYVFSCILIVFLVMTPDRTSAAAVFEHQNTIVPVGQTVDDVYVVGGDAEVLGHVTGIVVVINGDLHAANTAQIDGMIVVIGGQVNQEPGTLIGDDVYNLSLDDPTQTSLLIGGSLTVGLWMIQLGIVILLILVPTLIGLLGKKKMRSLIGHYAASSWSRLLYIGFLSGLALIAISALLAITIVGIPILIFILIAFIIAVFTGLTVISHRLGEQIRFAEANPTWLKVMVGAIVIASAINIPVLGWIVLLIVTMISLGVCVDGLASIRQRSSKSR